MAQIIDGRVEAARLKLWVADEVDIFIRDVGRAPHLAVVLVGNNPASVLYVTAKSHAAQEIGITSKTHKYDECITQEDLLEAIRKLNSDDDVDGILIQLPLPKHIVARDVIEAIDPSKDVDGFHPLNVGRLSSGSNCLVPCTPYGCMRLLATVTENITGMEAVVVGRSNIVGKPVATMLAAANATVTHAHSATQDIAALCRRADLLVCAVGHPEMVRGHWIKPGAIVIDVGISRVSGESSNQIVGDVAYHEAVKVAGAITPVPGGVGPMTIASLMRNTVLAAKFRERGATVADDWSWHF